MAISMTVLKDAAFWDQTICVNCGAVEGEARYACFHCDSAEVLPAKLILTLVESVEKEEGEGEEP